MVAVIRLAAVPVSSCWLQVQEFHTNRSDDVGHDVVFGALLCEGLGETDQAEFGGRVVGLAKVAEQASSGAGVDNTAILLLTEMRPGSS